MLLLFVALTLVQSIYADCLSELSDIAVTKNEKAWSKVSRILQPTSSQSLPSFVAMPKNIRDVQRSLLCAVSKGVRVAVKSGGHSFGGYSSVPSPGFMINLNNMREITWIGDTSVAVQAGATWADVYENFRVHGGLWLITGGLCPSVGVGGYTMGGGVGPVERAFGMATDNVLEFTLVTANGSNIVVANENVNSDLYWALRGGGGGNFGVVVEMKYRVYSGPPAYTMTQISFDPSDVKSSLLNVGIFDSTFPDIINLDISLDGTGVTYWIVYQGSATDSENVVGPLVQAGPKPTNQQTKTFDCFRELNEAYAEAHGYSNYSDTNFGSRGCFVKDLTPDVVNKTLTYPIPDNCGASILHFGGAISRKAVDSAAFPWRNAGRYIYMTCDWNTPDQQQTTMAYLEKWYSNMAPVCMGGYVNFIEPTNQNWREAYYGPNYAKLCEIKRKWNPAGSSPLRFAQEIDS